MDWNLIFNIVAALGIFEVVKRILLFGLENNFIKRNLELREIGQRVFDYCTELKLMHLIEPLPPEQQKQLRKDVIKIDQFDKELGDRVQKLYTNPVVIQTMYDNWRHSKDKEYHKTAVECQKELQSVIDGLLPEMEKLRYKSLISLKAILHKLLVDNRVS